MLFSRDIIISHPFSGEDDLYLLKDFVTSIMATDMQHSYWHVGDLLWGIYKDTIFDPRHNIRLWENEQVWLLRLIDDIASKDKSPETMARALRLVQNRCLLKYIKSEYKSRMGISMYSCIIGGIVVMGR